MAIGAISQEGVRLLGAMAAMMDEEERQHIEQYHGGW